MFHRPAIGAGNGFKHLSITDVVGSPANLKNLWTAAGIQRVWTDPPLPMPPAPTTVSTSCQAAVEWYLEHRRDAPRVVTRWKQRSALGIFVDWTDEAGIDDMTEVEDRHLMRFKTWRKTESDVNTVSLNDNLVVLQRFIRFFEAIGAVEADLAGRVPLPNVPPDEEISDVVPTDEEVEGIQSYFGTFEYTSRRHVQFELVAEVGLRLGDVRAIYLADFEAENRVIHLRYHRKAPTYTVRR